MILERRALNLKRKYSAMLCILETFVIHEAP